MLDAFTEVLFKNAELKKQEDEMTELMMKLPLDEVAKIASGKEACGMIGGGDGSWLKKYEGTPLFDQAIALEEEALQMDAQRLQKRMVEDTQREKEWHVRDAIDLKKRLLDLELRKAQVGTGTVEGGEEEEEPEDEAANAPSSTMFAEGAKSAEANFVHGVIHGFGKTAALEAAENAQIDANQGRIKGTRIGILPGATLGALGGLALSKHLTNPGATLLKGKALPLAGLAGGAIGGGLLGGTIGSHWDDPKAVAAADKQWDESYPKVAANQTMKFAVKKLAAAVQADPETAYRNTPGFQEFDAAEQQLMDSNKKGRLGAAIGAIGGAGLGAGAGTILGPKLHIGPMAGGLLGTGLGTLGGAIGGGAIGSRFNDPVAVAAANKRYNDAWNGLTEDEQKEASVAFKYALEKVGFLPAIAGGLAGALQAPKGHRLEGLQAGASGATLGSLKGSLYHGSTGAAGGAIGGSIVPGLGTAAGAAMGGATGAIEGGLTGGYSGYKKNMEALRQRLGEKEAGVKMPSFKDPMSSAKGLGRFGELLTGSRAKRLKNAVGGISHDLRNAGGSAETVKEQLLKRPTPDKARQLDAINQSIGAMKDKKNTFAKELSKEEPKVTLTRVGTGAAGLAVASDISNSKERKKKDSVEKTADSPLMNREIGDAIDDAALGLYDRAPSPKQLAETEASFRSSLGSTLDKHIANAENNVQHPIRHRWNFAKRFGIPLGITGGVMGAVAAPPGKQLIGGLIGGGAGLLGGGIAGAAKAPNPNKQLEDAVVARAALDNLHPNAAKDAILRQYYYNQFGEF